MTSKLEETPKIITTRYYYFIIHVFQKKSGKLVEEEEEEKRKAAHLSIYLSIYLLRKMACLMALPTTIYIYQRRQGRILCFIRFIIEHIVSFKDFGSLGNK
jgi:hypothetical protein